MINCNYSIPDEDPMAGDPVIELDNFTYFNIETGEIISLDGTTVFAHCVTFDDVKSWNLAQYYDYPDDFQQLIDEIVNRREQQIENIRHHEQQLRELREAA